MHPERLGPWQIERRIGAGGMGNVYLGVHAETGERAAVKVLPASMAREDGFEQRFSREIDALGKLSHRNIVRLYGNGVSDDGLLYYAMEFVDGVTLTAEIQARRRLPWREVVERSQQLAGALKAAHDAGVVHRDLKPGNLMVAADGQLKLTDFGVASVFAAERLTRTGGIVGTADYMSPEQARGQRSTPRSDLYALGAVIYTMLTGRPPFTGETTAELLRKQQYGQFDLPSRYAPDIPAGLEELVCQLLEKDPGRRPPDALVVLRRLEQVLLKAEFVERQLEAETVVRPAVGVGGVVGDGVAAAAAAGTATTVRNWLRAESQRGAPAGPGAWLDNIWVLMCLLVLLMGFGFWMSRGRREPTVSERLAEAERVLSGVPGPAWLKARDELLRPLLGSAAAGSADAAGAAGAAGAADAARLRELCRQADDYEFVRSLGEGLGERSGEQSAAGEQSAGEAVDEELRGLIRRAFELRRAGDFLGASASLEGVQQILDRVRGGSYLQRFVADSLAGWRSERAGQGAELLLRELLRQWVAAEGESERQQLRGPLAAALEIYGEREELAAIVAELRAATGRE